MSSLERTTWAVYLMCTLIVSHRVVRAQSDNSLNLTVTFSERNPVECFNASSGQGLTFSTAGVPLESVCFNIEDLFQGNTSTGVIQQSDALQLRPYEFTWAISDQQNYNPQANYSQLWYKQDNLTGAIGPGQAAARQLTIYSGRECKQGNGSAPRTLEPWIGWTCQSELAGQCDTVPISIKSFLIADAASINAGWPKCWDSAVMGDASMTKGTNVRLILLAALFASVFW